MEKWKLPFGVWGLEFPNIRGTFLGVPIVRIILYSVHARGLRCPIDPPRLRGDLLPRSDAAIPGRAIDNRVCVFTGSCKTLLNTTT